MSDIGEPYGSLIPLEDLTDDLIMLQAYLRSLEQDMYIQGVTLRLFYNDHVRGMNNLQQVKARIAKLGLTRALPSAPNGAPPPQPHTNEVPR